MVHQRVMFEAILLPMVTKLKVLQVQVSPHAVHAVLATTARAARCPTCQQLSRQVHSQYVRHLADLPWGRLPVHLELHTRRFLCWTPGCPQRVFTERVDELAPAYGRRTHALATALQHVGYAAGGRLGTRLAHSLHLEIELDSLLRLLRRGGTPTFPTAQVVGVDDFALRKGIHYGTLVVDLEAHHVLDLLPERSTDSWAEWLRDHPGVTVVSSDRAEVYTAGTRLGAPQAQPVADRWHLVHNLVTHVQQVVERHHGALRALSPPATLATTMPALAPSRLRQVQTRAEREHQQREQRARERYEQVQVLHRQGESVPAIARQVGLAARTVQRLVQAETFPGLPHTHPPRRAVAGFETLIQQSWAEGLRDVKALLRALRPHGYTGSYSALLAYVRSFAGASPEALVVPQPHAAPTLSPRAATWWLLGYPGRLTPRQCHLLVRWRDACPDVQTTQQFAARFLALLRERDVSALHPWWQEVAASAVDELRTWADRLRADAAAVEGALVCPWSNGQTEGQVNRLKWLKRQMYGRANFDLLRVRVLNKV